MQTNNSEAVKSRVKMALAMAGLTQIECARIAKIPRDYIHKATQRGSIPSSKDIRNRISKTLNSDDSYLWFGIEETQATPSKKLKVSKEALKTGKIRITIEIDSDQAEKVFALLKQ
jgi:hypothetical protein|tara:strand:+ start:104 stop:451 length:348 start_codon:yes stop_codon:yes gene_type:complete